MSEPEPMVVLCNAVHAAPRPQIAVVIRRCMECKCQVWVGRVCSLREKAPGFMGYTCFACWDTVADRTQAKKFGAHTEAEWEEIKSGLRRHEVGRVADFVQRLTGKRPGQQ